MSRYALPHTRTYPTISWRNRRNNGESKTHYTSDYHRTFCGGLDVHEVDSNAHILCFGCGVEIIFDFRYLEGVNWNTRPLEDALQAQVKAREK